MFEIGQIDYGATLSLRAYRRRAQDSEVKVASLSIKLSVVNHSIIEFSFSRVHSGTFFIVLRDLWQRQDQANKFILLYAWCDNHRG